MRKILIVFLLFILGSCASTKYVEVPVETVKTEYIDRTKVDTFIQKDSIRIIQRGDTIFQDKYKILYRIKEYRDTVNKVDTITKIQKVEVTKEVNRLKSWQQILMVCGGGLIVGILGLLGYLITKILKK
jgi:hypothetical protein